MEIHRKMSRENFINDDIVHVENLMNELMFMKKVANDTKKDLIKQVAIKFCAAWL